MKNLGIFTVFDIAEKSVLVETRILSDRFSGKVQNDPKDLLDSPRVKKVLALGGDLSLFIVYAGRDWSLLSANPLIEWKTNSKAMAATTAAAVAAAAAAK